MHTPPPTPARSVSSGDCSPSGSGPPLPRTVSMPLQTMTSTISGDSDRTIRATSWNWSKGSEAREMAEVETSPPFEFGMGTTSPLLEEGENDDMLEWMEFGDAGQSGQGIGEQRISRNILDEMNGQRSPAGIAHIGPLATLARQESSLDIPLAFHSSQSHELSREASPESHRPPSFALEIPSSPIADAYPRASRPRPLSIRSIGGLSLISDGEEGYDSRYATSSATSRAVTTPTSLEFDMDDLLNGTGREEDESGEWMMGEGPDESGQKEKAEVVLEQDVGPYISLTTTLRRKSKTSRSPLFLDMPSRSTLPAEAINPSPSSSFQSDEFESDLALFTFPPSPAKRSTYSQSSSPRIVRHSPPLNIHIIKEFQPLSSRCPLTPSDPFISPDTPLDTANLSAYSAETTSAGPVFEALIDQFPQPVASVVETLINGVYEAEEDRFEFTAQDRKDGSQVPLKGAIIAREGQVPPFATTTPLIVSQGSFVHHRQQPPTSSPVQQHIRLIDCRRSRRRHSLSSPTPTLSCIHVRPQLFRSRSHPILPSPHTQVYLSFSSRAASMIPTQRNSAPFSNWVDYSSLPLSTTPILNSARPPLSYPISEPLPRVSEEGPGQAEQDSPTRIAALRSGEAEGYESRLGLVTDRGESLRDRFLAATSQAPFASSYRSPLLTTFHSSRSEAGDRYSNSSSYTHSSTGMSLSLAGGLGTQSVPDSVTSSPTTKVESLVHGGGRQDGGKAAAMAVNISTFGPGDHGAHQKIGQPAGLAAPAMIHGQNHIESQQPTGLFSLPSHSPPLSSAGSPYSVTKALRLPQRSPTSSNNSWSPPPAPVRPPRLDMRIPSARFSGSEVAAAGNRAAEDMASGNHFNRRVDDHGDDIVHWDQRGHTDSQRELGELREEEREMTGTPSRQHDQPLNIHQFAFPAVPNSSGSETTDIVSPSSVPTSPRISQAGSHTLHVGNFAEKAMPLSSRASTLSASVPEDTASEWRRARQATTGSTGTTRSGSSYGAQPLPPLTSDYSANGPSLATYHKHVSQGRQGMPSVSSTGALSYGPPPARSLQRLGHQPDQRSLSTNTSGASSHTPSYHPFSAASSSFPGRRQSTATLASNYQPDSHLYGAPRDSLGKRPSADQLSAGGAMVDVMPSNQWPSDNNPLSVVIAPERELNTNPHSAAVVNSHVQEGEDTCPICVESLNASYRLPGEKAHIVPQCGHALHEACFTEVYGAIPKGPRASKVNLGVCGVCRGEMRLEDEDDGFGPPRSRGNSKFAAMTGMNNKPASIGRKGVTASSAGLPISTSTLSFHSTTQSPVEVNGDDPVELAVAGASPSTHSLTNPGPPSVIVPSITIKSEFASISRVAGRSGKQVLTCLVTVEVPSAGPRAGYPAPPLPSPEQVQGEASPISPASSRSSPAALWDRRPSGHSALPDFLIAPSAAAPDPFAHIAADLRNRMVDYKTSAVDTLGKIRLYDILRVRKGSFILDISVYLFQQAMICVSEERKKGFKSLLSSGGGSNSSRGDHKEKGVLKLKGRIYLRHVKRIIDSTVGGELSLTISMEDESLDSFILTFSDRSSHDLWRKTLNHALQEAKGISPSQPMSPPVTPRSGGTTSSKLARMGMPEDVINDTLRSPNLSNMSGQEFSSPSANSASSMPDKLQGSFGSAPLAPVHTTVDLLIALSIPSSRGPAAASAPLKLKLIKASLTFICQTLGPRDRLSVVTFQPGTGTVVRKTPFLCPGRFSGREKLDKFVAGIVADDFNGSDDGEDVKDEFRAEIRKDEKVDMVSGLNVGLDIVMQRKAKNPITGMILVNDSVDSIKRSSMDLVLARAEAAGVPVHSLGYGKNQDPSGLWLISSHTHGTYTFVKEWYHLRDSLAGVIGGLTSIALTNMKVHLGASDSEFKCRKVSGAPHAVLSTDGKDVDIELKELRFGQRLEVLIEMEVEREIVVDASEVGHPQSHHPSSRQSMIGSDEDDGHRSHNGDERQVRKSSSFTTDSGAPRSDGDNLVQMSDDNLIDEVPVFDLDCSYFDPAAGRAVARLSHPLLLTVSMLPARHTGQPPGADQAVSRRKFELMASESMTRALLLVSRQNWSQAQRILQETAKILMAVINQAINFLGDGDSPNHHPLGGGTKASARRQNQARATALSLQAVLGDLDFLQEGMDEQRDSFERDHRHFGAQQALVLRTQKSWTARTPTEKLYCSEGPRQLLAISREWTSR